MGTGVDFDLQSRQFHYAVSGKTLNDGRRASLPKSKPQEALDSVVLISPPPQDGLSGRVVEAEGGSYPDGIILKDFVLIQGLQTAIVTSDPIAIKAANDLTCDMQAAVALSPGGIGLSIDGNNMLGVNLAATQALGAGGIAIEIKGVVDQIFVNSTQVAIKGDGSFGYKITSSHVTALDLNSDVFNFGDINQTFFEYNTVNTDDLCDLNISTVESDAGGGAGGYSGSKGFVVRNGDLKVRIGSLSAETFTEVESGGRLSLQGNAIEGNTVIKTGGICVYDSLSIIDGNLNTEGTGLLQARVSNIIGDATLADTSSMSIISDKFIGELIVGASSTLFAFIDTYTGTLPPDDGRVRGFINGIPFGNYKQKPVREFVLTASSLSTQPPTGIDAPLKVEFGGAQFGLTDPVQIDVFGNITINQPDQYNVDVKFHAGRTGAGSFSVLIFRLLINGSQIGDSTAIRLDNANSHFPVNISEPLNLIATDVLTVEIWRDSSGFDDGSLFPETPTLAGSNPVPSAAITITKSRLTQPV